MAFTMTIDYLPQLSEPDELRANVYIKTLSDDVYSDVLPNLFAESNVIIVFVGLTLVETAPINDRIPLFTPVPSYRRHKLPQEPDVKYTRCALRMPSIPISTWLPFSANLSLKKSSREDMSL